MNLVDVGAVYAAVGVACAVAVFRRGGGRGIGPIASALVAVPLWPLWAPIALGGAPPRSAPPTPIAKRVARALEEAAAACAGTPYASMLSPEASARIAAEVARASTRLDELDALLAGPGFDAAAAERRVHDLDAAGDERAAATARVHAANVVRLRALRERDARALDELADLVHALHAQLLLARYEGHAAARDGGIVTEIWARLDVLRAVDVTESGGAEEGSRGTTA